MTHEEKREILVEELYQYRHRPAVDDRELDEAVHAMNELGMWPDFVGSVSVEQVKLCHQLVEFLRDHKIFPEELRV